MKWDPWQFFDIPIIYTRQLQFNLGFWGTFRKLYHALAEHARKRFHHLLSIRGNNFITHWVDAKRIFVDAQPAFKLFTVFSWALKSMQSQRGNDLIACWAHTETIVLLAEHRRKRFHRLLSIRENNFIAGWAYVETISSLAEPAEKWDKLHDGQSISSTEGETRLWRGRLVYRGGDSSTKGKIRLRRGTLF